MTDRPQLVPFNQPGLRIVPPGPKISVPVSAHGCTVFDANGQPLANCFAPELAARLAYIINEHAEA